MYELCLCLDLALKVPAIYLQNKYDNITIYTNQINNHSTISTKIINAGYEVILTNSSGNLLICLSLQITLNKKFNVAAK